MFYCPGFSITASAADQLKRLLYAAPDGRTGTLSLRALRVLRGNRLLVYNLLAHHAECTVCNAAEQRNIGLLALAGTYQAQNGKHQHDNGNQRLNHAEEAADDAADKRNVGDRAQQCRTHNPSGC